jgi:tripartite-type tricarboxylate transporter receptor subunit TctC
MAGITMTSIPYKGSGPGITALLAGEVDVAISSIMTLVQHVKSGSVRALAVTSAQRSSLAPDVPTVAEKGIPGYEASTWYGMLAPAATPPDIVRRLNDTLRTALQDPEVRKQMLGQGLEPATDSPQEFARFIQEDREKWAKVVKESGLQTN